VTEDRLPVEYELLKDVAALDLEVIETLGDNTHVEIRMKEDPDRPEVLRLGLDLRHRHLLVRRRPRGNSEMMQ
jgi:hypothetical protein